jgi:hypothetical protein
MPKSFRNSFWIVVLSILFVTQAFAQGGATGAITGTVVDPTGALVANADIRIINQDTGETTRAATTDASGAFIATLLPVGTYTVSITRTGFQEGRFTDIVVRVTETTRMTARLSPLKVLEKVEVQALVQSVETTTATTGQAIESQTIRDLPLATQNFQQLLTLSPGAQSDLNGSAQLGRGDVRIQVNGQREDNNNYLIEGISATDYNVAELTNTPLPSPDVVQEFKVQTSLYDATQGRNGGGNINAILKSGTKTFHGSLFEFFRNTSLNANEWFLKNSELSLDRPNARPDIKQNIYGGSLGGPLGHDAKLGYFFLNYQGTRQRSGLSAGTILSTVIPYVPTQRDAQTLVSTFFPNDPNVTAANIDPVALKLLNFQSSQFNDPNGFLIPSADPATGKFVLSKAGKYTDDQFTLNYDREFRGAADKISSRFFFSNFRSVLPFGAGGLQATLGGTINETDLNFPLDLPVRDRFLSVAETHLFSPRLVNEFRFGYVHINNKAINTPIVNVNDLGINRPNSNLYQTIYKFTFGSYQIGPTPGADQSQLQNNYTFLDTASYTLGKHLLRFGGEYDRVNLNKNFPQTFNGQLFFYPSAGDPTNPGDPCVPIGGCTDFDNFLLGQPGFSFGGSGVSNHQYKVNDYALFLQDDIKVTPDFTLNAGLRWELFGAAKDDLCHIGNTQASLVSQGIVPFFYPKCVDKLGVSGFTGTASDTTMNNNYASNFGPRVGFAYDVLGRHTTSIRGGYGIFYVREDVGAVDQLSFTAPILPITTPIGTPGDMADLFAVGPGRLPVGGVIDPNFVPTFSHFLGFSNCGAADITQCAPMFDGNMINLFGLEVPRHFVSPSTAQWNLSIQRQLPKDWVLEIAYVGTKGTHLRETRDGIQPYDATVHPVTVTDTTNHTYTITTNTYANAAARSRALGLATGNYQIFASDAWSHYNGLQVTASHRFSRSFYFQGGYTYAKALDATSSGNTAFNTAINDQTNLRDSYGPSDFDRTHRLVLSYNWDLPFMSKAKGVAGALLGRWALSGITTFQSGTPFTVIDAGGGTAFALSSPNTATATLNPGFTIASAQTHGSVQRRINQWFDPNAISGAPTIGVDGTTGYGNLGRNPFRGPFQQNWDISLGKNFRITERTNFKFTTDFFNIWNHPIFASPSGIFNATGFGQITATKGTPRLIQFSGRFSF